MVEGHKRKTGSCTHKTVVPPATKNDNDGSKCLLTTTTTKNIPTKFRAPKSDKILMHTCSKCNKGEHAVGIASAFSFDRVSEKEEAQCLSCPAGYIAESKGLRSCVSIFFKKNRSIGFFFFETFLNACSVLVVSFVRRFCCVLLCLVVSNLTHCCVCLFALGVFSVDEYE